MDILQKSAELMALEREFQIMNLWQKLVGGMLVISSIGILLTQIVFIRQFQRKNIKTTATIVWKTVELNIFAKIYYWWLNPYYLRIIQNTDKTKIHEKPYLNYRTDLGEITKAAPALWIGRYQRPKIQYPEHTGASIPIIYPQSNPKICMVEERGGSARLMVVPICIIAIIFGLSLLFIS